MSMFEKVPTVTQENPIDLNDRKDELQKVLEQINSELPEQPQLDSFFRNHPNYSENMVYLIESLGMRFETLDDEDIELLNRINKLESKVDTDIWGNIEDYKKDNGDYKKIIDVYYEYKQAVEIYEEKEREVFKKISINGESFGDPKINRLIRESYSENGNWNLSEGDVNFQKFNNEWQRFYQIIKNDDPLSNLDLVSKISLDIEKLFESYGLYEGDNNDGYDDNVENFFNKLDKYFDIQNMELRFIVTTIDLLFMVQEFDKEDYDAFDDRISEIDRQIHEYRETSFVELISEYIGTRLEPLLTTAFDNIKYKATVDSWEDRDSDYTNNSQIFLPLSQIRRLLKEENIDSELIRRFCENERLSIDVSFNKDYLSEYVSNDGFYVYKKNTEGRYEHITTKELLENESVVNFPVTNDMVGDYRSLMDLRVIVSLEKVFGLNLLDLSIKEQFYFLNYLKQVTNTEVEEVKNFTKEYGVQGMRTFLSLQQYGDDMGDKIVGFGTAHESAGEVFASYGALLDEVESFEDFVHHELVCDQENCKELIKKARERLLFDANSYLANSVSSNNPDTVVEVLNQKKVEAKALSAAIMTYMSTVGSSIEDFNSFHKNTYDNNIEPQLLDELKNIYTKNYQNIGYDKEAIDSLVENLEKKIDSADTKIKTWEFGNDKILAFTAVTENQQDKSAYISGLNVNPDLKTAKAAKSLLEETISEYSEKGFVIKAEATADNFQGYGEMDWVATALKDDDLGQENFLFDIAIYPTQKFFSKSLTKKEIREMVLDTDEYIGSDGMVVVKNPDASYLNNMLEKGYVVTRYFKTRKISEIGQKEEIFVLEKLDETMNYSTATQIRNAA